jgi:uncharacterized DUF497 family protein
VPEECIDIVNISSYTPNMTYDWDQTKYIKNLKDHKIRFEDAQEVFSDAGAKEYLDVEHSTRLEERYEIIGMSSKGILFVVYCERVSIEGEMVIRIISARKAERDEVDLYYGK